ncbi:MAG: thiamine phosphate synthase [Lentisphaeria bacterium]|nr:thiamine phosphate synthase [Lentisphaeria bacterium]
MKTLAERVAAFTSSTLYPVVSSEFCSGRSVTEVIAAIADGGAKIVQLREKHRSDADLFALASKVRAITAAHDMLLIIDDRLDIALACRADGVHLGQDDLPVAVARKIAPELLIGSSTHNAAEVIAAQQADTGYLNIGPIYPTQTKSVACGALGVPLFTELKNLVHCPFSVMGGIKARHLPELRALGAEHIAMVTEITTAPDVSAKVRELLKFWQ